MTDVDELIGRLLARRIPGEPILDGIGYARSSIPDPDCVAAATALAAQKAEIETYKRAFRWFAKWPEYKVADEYLPAACRDVEAARAIYNASPIPIEDQP